MTATLDMELARATRGGGRDATDSAFRVVRSRGWVSFEADWTAEADADSLHGWLGRPGLWKAVAHEGRPVAVFDLPAELTDRRSVDEWPDDVAGTVSALEQLAAWAAASLAGGAANAAFAGWAPPPKDEVESWVPDGGLTVEHGPIALKGRVIHGPERLAIAIPVLTDLPRELTPRRMQWLRAVLADAQDRWRMVRIGMTGRAGDGRPGTAVEAEIDLTGAPAWAVEPLFRRSVAALGHVVRWAAPLAALIVDAVAGAMLDTVPPPPGFSWPATL